jgi:hypothetical protein
MGWLSKGDLVFAYEDYHRRMEAPITDEVVEMEEFTPEEAEERMEGAMKPPPLIKRLFRRRGRAKDEPTDVRPMEDVEELVVIEREEPGPRVSKQRVVRRAEEGTPEEESTAPTAEEAGWEEEPPSQGAPPSRETASRWAQREWEESPATRSKKEPEPVEKVPKRRV